MTKSLIVYDCWPSDYNNIITAGQISKPTVLSRSCLVILNFVVLVCFAQPTATASVLAPRNLNVNRSWFLSEGLIPYSHKSMGVWIILIGIILV